MIQVVKSLLGVSDTEFYNELQIILSDENKTTLSPDELAVFSYLVREFNHNKQFPTQEVFLLKFPQYRDQLNDYEAFAITDFRYYRKQFVTKHINIYKSKVLYKMAGEAAIDGITPEMAEVVRRQANFDNDVEEEHLSFRERYMKSMKNNAGLKTYVEQIDHSIS